MHAGDRRHRARGAEQVEAAATLAAGDARGEGAERIGDAARHRGEDFRRDLVAAEFLGQRDDAEAQRLPAPACRRTATPSRRAAVEPDDLRRAAADVEQHDRLGARGRRARRSRRRPATPRSRGRRSRARGRAVRAPGRGTRRRSRRRGRLRWRSARARVTPRAAILSRQTLQRSSVRSIAASLEPTGLREPLAEADDARERVDDAKSVRGRTRHQQAAIVRAQIQRGVGAARRAAIPRRPPEARCARSRRAPHLGSTAIEPKLTPCALARKRPGRGFAADCSKPGAGCNATRVGAAPGQGLKNGWRTLSPALRPICGRDAAVEFEHRRARAARRNERLRQRLGAIDDPRHRAVAAR